MNENLENAENGIDSHFVCAEGVQKRCQAFGMTQSVNEKKYESAEENRKSGEGYAVYKINFCVNG